MDGIHDLGGKHGFGGSLAERDEAEFHRSWEPRVRAMAGLMIGQGCFNVDAFRHAIERLDPAVYLTDGYFGRWLGAVEKLVEEADRRPQAGLYPDTTARRETELAPRYALGDVVVTRNLHPAGHTRLPSYARSCRGTVALLHGAWVFPDTHAHDAGENPQHVYAVRFEARDLWGNEAEAGTCVHVDLFESYLAPAHEPGA
jgi:nitrile hydratase